MQTSYAGFARNNAAMRGAQEAHDRDEPCTRAADRADSIETECTIFAERFTDNQMDAPTFFELAEAFGSETIGDYLAEDDQHNLLQLVLAARKAGVFDAYTKPVIARLYTAAYKHKEQEYGQQ